MGIIYGKIVHVVVSEKHRFCAVCHQGGVKSAVGVGRTVDLIAQGAVDQGPALCGGLIGKVPSDFFAVIDLSRDLNCRCKLLQGLVYHAHVGEGAAVFLFHCRIGFLVPIYLRLGDGGIRFFVHAPFFVFLFFHEFATVIQEEERVCDQSVRAENGKHVIAVAVHRSTVRGLFGIRFH